MSKIRIEPERHRTFSKDGFVAAFEYSVHPRGSVLAGQERRVFLDNAESVEELKAKYPTAEIDTGCQRWLESAR